MRNLFGTQGPPGWLVTGGIASIAVAYLVFAFLPSQKAIGMLRGQLKEKQRQIEASGALTGALAESQRQLEATERIIKRWRQDAPSPSELTHAYAQFSESAHNANVRIVRLDPQPVKERGLVIEHGMTVSVEGDFEGIFRFLAGVESLSNTAWVRTMNIQKSGGMGEDLRCDLTLTIFGDFAD